MEAHLEELEKKRQESVKNSKSNKQSRKEEKKVRPRDRLFDADGRRKKSQSEQLQVKPMFVVAHELYDALPIHQFKY